MTIKNYIYIGENAWYQYNDLTKTKKRLCLITANADEYIEFFPKHTHVSTLMPDKRGPESMKNFIIIWYCGGDIIHPSFLYEE